MFNLTNEYTKRIDEIKRSHTVSFLHALAPKIFFFFIIPLYNGEKYIETCLKSSRVKNLKYPIATRFAPYRVGRCSTVLFGF